MNNSAHLPARFPLGSKYVPARHHLLLLLHDADAAIATGGSGYADLCVTIIRITPESAFE